MFHGSVTSPVPKRRQLLQQLSTSPDGALKMALLIVMVMWMVHDTSQIQIRSFPGLVEDIEGDDVIVSTDAGDVRGKRRIGDANADGATTTVDWFLGIPYAQPPVGQLRFKAPEFPHPWRPTVRNATRFGPACPQRNLPDLLWYASEEFQDEDCLYLNIYTPYQNQSPPGVYPVMLYVHGGSYVVGSGNVYVGHLLAQQGVVIVTVNYRLGMLGFLASRDPVLKGNYGLLDVIKALEWVKINIRWFGGDPDRVTLVGHSAGAGAVGLVNISPLAKGLVSKVIMQSGSPLAFWAVHDETVDLTSYLRSVATGLSCNHGNVSDIVSCLRDVDWRSFIREQDQDNEINRLRICPMRLHHRPTIDGEVIPLSPKILYEQGLSASTAVMTGIVEDEWAGHYGLFLEDFPDKGLLGFSWGELLREHFEMLLRHVLIGRFGFDELIYEMVRQQYTNWGMPNDKKQNRYQYLKFGSDVVFLAPTIQLVDILHSRNVPVYTYVFNYRDESFPGLQNYHHAELSYLFGSPFTGLDVFSLKILYGNKSHGYGDEERNLSKTMMELWTNFAKSGDPSKYSTGHVGNRVQWFPHNNTESYYLEISANSTRVLQYLRAGQMEFWNRVVPCALDRLGKRQRVNCGACSIMRGCGGMLRLILLASILILTTLTK